MEPSLSYYHECFSLSADDVDSIGNTVLLPRFQEKYLLRIISLTKDLLVVQKPVRYVKGNIIIVGDVHGNIRDLFRILLHYGMPPTISYLFLGDYVDRGQFSLEVITLLFTLKVIFPNNITLIRGNHEFRSVNSHYGFKEECDNLFSNTIVYDAFNDAFDYLPFVAIVNDVYFCVHGGISKNLYSIKTIEKIEYPVTSDSNELIKDMVWSDPSPSDTTFSMNPRGSGCMYGCIAVLYFLQSTHMRAIIRGHQCVNGFKFQQRGTVITVFSASNYSPRDINDAGALEIKETGLIEGHLFKPSEFIQRSNANFYDVVIPEKNILPRIKLYSSLPVAKPIKRARRSSMRRMSSSSILI